MGAVKDDPSNMRITQLRIKFYSNPSDPRGIVGQFSSYCAGAQQWDGMGWDEDEQLNIPYPLLTKYSYYVKSLYCLLSIDFTYFANGPYTIY